MLQDGQLQTPENDTPPRDRPIEAIRAACEQLLMSYIGTTLSLMSLGFSIYKFFDESPRPGQAARILTPRLMGMLMISAGLLTLFYAHAEHRIAYRHLRLLFPTLRRSLTGLLSGFILCIGVLFFIAALLRQ